MLDSAEDLKDKWVSRISHPIVLAADAPYAMQLATTIRSIVEANQGSWPLDVYVLSDGFSEAVRTKVLNSLPKDAISLSWVPVDLGLFHEFATLPWISKMTFVRLLIPRALPETIARVLYLDSDLLVLDDLTPLWKVSLDETVVGAVLDRWDSQIKQREPGLEDVPRVKDYFNSGVLLIDLKRWRKERISEKALDYLVLHPRTPFGDQDALNVACDGLWTKLDPRWNYQNHCGIRVMDMRLEERPGVVHFIGAEKPWLTTSYNLNASLYDAFRSRTCFARSFMQKCLDMLWGGWFFRLKEILRRYAFVRDVWRYFRNWKPNKNSR